MCPLEEAEKIRYYFYMTKISEILQRIIPSADGARLVQIWGTAKQDVQVINTALDEFSLSIEQFLVFCLPISWLACTTPRSRALRDRLLNVDNNWLELSVALPEGAVEVTMAPYALLVLNSKRNEENLTSIRFVDAREEDAIEAVADYREIFLRKQPLLPAYYCQDTAVAAIEKIRSTGRLLSEVVDILVAPMPSDKGTEYSCLSVREFSDFGYTIPCESAKKFYQAIGEEFLLRQNDLIFVLQGSVTRVAIVGQIAQKSLPAYMTCILRSHTVDPRALYVFLRSEVVQSYISLSLSGTSLSRLPVATLKNLPVPGITGEQEKEMISLFTELDTLRLKIKDANNQATSLLKKFYSLK